MIEGVMYSVDGPHVVGLEEIDSLKVAANNLYSDGRFGQAIIGYSYAIKQIASLLLPNARKSSINLDSPSSVAQAIRDSKASPRQMQVAGVLYCNRSAAYLKLEKFDKASIDAGAAAILDPTNFKAWFRKGLAHKEMNQWFECHQAMKHAVKLESNNEDVKTLFEEAKYKMTMPQAHAPPPAPPPVTESRSRRKLGIFGR